MDITVYTTNARYERMSKRRLKRALLKDLPMKFKNVYPVSVPNLDELEEDGDGNITVEVKFSYENCKE